MKSTVYIETSFISYLTSRPSRDLVTAANQQLTHDWWNDRRENFDLFISQFVINEWLCCMKTGRGVVGFFRV